MSFPRFESKTESKTSLDSKLVPLEATSSPLQLWEKKPSYHTFNEILKGGDLKSVLSTCNKELKELKFEGYTQPIYLELKKEWLIKATILYQLADSDKISSLGQKVLTKHKTKLTSMVQTISQFIKQTPVQAIDQKDVKLEKFSALQKKTCIDDVKALFKKILSELHINKKDPLYLAMQSIFTRGFVFLDELPKNILFISTLDEIDFYVIPFFYKYPNFFHGFNFENLMGWLLRTEDNGFHFEALLKRLKIPIDKVVDYVINSPEKGSYTHNWPIKLFRTGAHQLHLQFVHKIDMKEKIHMLALQGFVEDVIFLNQNFLAQHHISYKDLLLKTPHNFKSFVRKKFGVNYENEFYHWQLMSSADLIECLINALPTFETLNELEVVLRKADILLHELARKDPRAAKLILASKELSAILPTHELVNLRNLIRSDEKLFPLAEINQIKDLRNLLEDIQQIFMEVSEIINKHKNYDSFFTPEKINNLHKKCLFIDYLLSNNHLPLNLNNIIQAAFLLKALVLNLNKLMVIDEKAPDEKNIHQKNFVLKYKFQARINKILAILNNITFYLTNTRYSENPPPNAGYNGKHFLKIRDGFTLPYIFPEANSPIPKLIHYHWFGDSLPVKYAENILLTHHHASDHKIIIWTNNPSALLKKVRNELGLTAETTFRKIVEVIDIQVLLEEIRKISSPETFTLIETIFINEIGWTPDFGRLGIKSNGFTNFAVASDLTRLLGLLVYGGIYLDTDVIPLSKFVVPYHHYNHCGFGRVCMQNCMLFSTANHPIVRIAITGLLNAYQNEKKQFVQSFSEHSLRRLFKPIPKLNNNRLEATLQLSGPTRIRYSIHEYQAQGGKYWHEIENDRSLFLNIKAQCDSTWLADEEKRDYQFIYKIILLDVVSDQIDPKLLEHPIEPILFKHGKNISIFGHLKGEWRVIPLDEKLFDKYKFPPVGKEQIISSSSLPLAIQKELTRVQAHTKKMEPKLPGFHI